MTDKEANNKKYNEIMKNEKLLEEKRTAGIVVGIISSIIILFIIYKYGLTAISAKFAEKITQFFKFIMSKSPSLKKNLGNIFEPINRLTTLMFIIAIIVVSVLIHVFSNLINNRYEPSNTPLLWIFGILSVLLTIFFIMRFETHKDKIVNDDGNTFMGQLKNIGGIMKKNYKTIVGIGVLILTIVIFSLFSFSSDKAFVTGSSFIFALILIGVMFAAYSLIRNSDVYKKWIEKNQLFHLIFNLIFLIPCVIVFAVNWVSDQIKNTPSFVYIILLIQIAIITLHFLIPFTERHLYFSLSNKKTNSEDLNKIMEHNRIEKDYLSKKILNLKKKLFKKSTNENTKNMNEHGINDTWDELFKLYSENESNDYVKSRLINLGLCTSDPKTDCDEHIEYIIKTHQEIIIMEQKLKTIKTEISPKEKIGDSGLAGEDENYDIKDINDAIVLKMAPVSLKQQTTPTTVEDVNLFINIADQPNYSYSLSFWVFMHTQLGSIKECNNIINFDGRPQILYCPVYKKIPLHAVVKYTESPEHKPINATITKVYTRGNQIYSYDLTSVSLNSQNKYDKYRNVHGSKITYEYPYSVLKFKLGTDEDTKQEFIMPNLKMQRWNNIVINFIDGTYDLFINGNLVNSFQGVMEKFKYNKINIGDNNGASGGIANIVYYKNYLTKDKILRNYNFLKNKSPPVVSSLLKY